MNKFKWIFKILEYKIKIIRTWVISDRAYLEKKFRQKFGFPPNLSKPKTFNEKIIYRILFEDTQRFSYLADKITARDYVMNNIGEEYIVPIVGIYSKFNEIEFEALPDKFVLKCNHDSASAIICTDKNKFSLKEAKNKINFCLSRGMYSTTRERHYRNIPPKIICEHYLDVFEGKDRSITPEIYRVHCFSGKAEYIEADFTDDNGQESVNIYNKSWGLLQATTGHPNNINSDIKKPPELDELLLLSEKLAAEFEYCRMDWFIVNGKIYFSEFTFTPCAGRMEFQPYDVDQLFGSLWEKNTITKNGNSLCQ